MAYKSIRLSRKNTMRQRFKGFIPGFFTMLFSAFLISSVSGKATAATPQVRYLSSLGAAINDDDSANITIGFSESVSILSSNTNAGSDIVQIDLRFTKKATRTTNKTELRKTENFGWKTTEKIPLLKVSLEPSVTGQSRLFLYFSVPVNIMGISEGKDFRSLEVKIATSGKKQKNATTQPPSSDQRLKSAMEKAQTALRQKEYSTAINIFTAILEEPSHRYSPDALEFLGVARERNGQTAHAYAEYERYLALYPNSSGAGRVQQRLAGLQTAADMPKEKLRKAQSQNRKEEWEVSGGFASTYERIQSNGDGLATEIAQSDLLNNFDVFANRYSEDSDSEFRLSTDYNADLLDNTESETKISYAYFDHQLTNGLGVRLGRQRNNSSGTLSRFDGAVFSYKQNKKLKYNFVYGAPVERTGDSFIHKEKRFYGISTELGTISDHWDYSAFLINQESDSIKDRQAIGGEVRYYDKQKSFYSLLDYDLMFAELNSWSLVGNFNLAGGATAYLNFDYRYSPILTTSNALQGEQINSLADLANSLSEDKLQQLAKDKTSRARLLAVGGSKPLSEALSVGGDLSISNISPTDESNENEEVVLSTGNEYFYSLYLTKTGLFRDKDIGILTFQYSDGISANTIALTGNSRFRASSKLRLNGKLRISSRSSSATDSSRITLEPDLRLEYELGKSLQLESQLGVVLRQEKFKSDTSNSQDYIFNFGGRWNF